MVYYCRQHAGWVAVGRPHAGWVAAGRPHAGWVAAGRPLEYDKIGFYHLR